MSRPRVVTFNVVSIDGRLTIAPEVSLLAGDARWTAVAGDSDPYDWVREVHDPEVLLEGSGSFVAPDAPPIAYPPYAGDPAPLYEDFLPEEVVGVAGRRWLALVDGRGRVQLQFKEWPEPGWEGWHALMVTSRAVAPAHLAWLREQGIPYLVAGPGPVDLAVMLDQFADRLATATVVSTAGGQLNGALLRAGLVDEIDVELIPAAIGGRGTPALFDAPPLRPDEEPVPLRLLSDAVTGDGHVLLRYAVADRD